MSIYFQYPSIDEYQNLVYPINTARLEGQNEIVEDIINQQHFEDSKDYLALKPI
ncbi:hypothetical protein GJU39_16205 [Pedobacter petrophilus]|uniref:Uncharacterized protein n=1 Tax=Pedobacter petrophilus TaxID=1908241 RepID=A0A7K0G1Z4_9SPHI|nr:hypothetical protein [Pedobacter petrophilus]MRX77632.1 hypothetical protein [Pedobacter petrophilus]